jgi:hypothetical protein
MVLTLPFGKVTWTLVRVTLGGRTVSDVGVALAQSQNGIRSLFAASWYFDLVELGNWLAMRIAICWSFCFWIMSNLCYMISNLIEHIPQKVPDMADAKCQTEASYEDNNLFEMPLYRR